MWADGSGLQLPINKTRRADLGPIGVSGDHLWALSAIADPASDVNFADPVIGQAGNHCDFCKFIILKPPNPQGFCQMRPI